MIIVLCVCSFLIYKKINRSIEYKKTFQELANKKFYYNNPKFEDMYDDEDIVYELELKENGTYICYSYFDTKEEDDEEKGTWEISYYNDGLYLRSDGSRCSGHYNIINSNLLECTSCDNKNMKLYTSEEQEKLSNKIDSIIEKCITNPNSIECISQYNTEEGQGEKEKISSENTKSFCIDKAKKAVKNKLKVPSTAEFSDLVVLQANSDGCNVKGKVDSQNAYGVVLQNSFIYFVDSQNEEYVEFIE